MFAVTITLLPCAPATRSLAATHLETLHFYAKRCIFAQTSLSVRSLHYTVCRGRFVENRPKTINFTGPAPCFLNDNPHTQKERHFYAFSKTRAHHFIGPCLRA